MECLCSARVRLRRDRSLGVLLLWLLIHRPSFLDPGLFPFQFHHSQTMSRSLHIRGSAFPTPREVVPLSIGDPLLEGTRASIHKHIMTAPQPFIISHHKIESWWQRTQESLAIHCPIVEGFPYYLIATALRRTQNHCTASPMVPSKDVKRLLLLQDARTHPKKRNSTGVSKSEEPE